MTSVSDFYKKIFGQKVYKISLDLGCTCPTRDGTKGRGGCIFCSQTGSGDFTSDRSLSITDQIEQAKLLVNKKFSRAAGRGEEVEKKYIAYFQNFTNTYGNANELLEKYKEALAAPNIVGLAIATRPDCLGEEILQGIAELSKNHFIQLELGFQTSNEKSAELFRRGFDNSVYEQAVKKVAQIGQGRIHVVSHVMFGLPGDTKEDMLNTVGFVCEKNKNSCFGIKITSVYVLEGTELADLYRQGNFKTLELEEYLLLIEQALKIFPEDVVVHRLTGDPPKALLITPEWTCNKRNVMNKLQRFYTTKK